MKDKLLTAKDEELSRLLGEMLERKHCFGTVSSFVDDKTAICWNCGKHETGDVGTCPIPLEDWNVAMKWRDWAVEEYGLLYYNILISLAPSSGRLGKKPYEYAIMCFKPKHYLISAALCKESERGLT